MFSLTGKQRDKGSSMPRSKQRKKTSSSTSFSAKHPQTTRMKKQKKNFYNKVLTLCDKLKEKDMTILMGELNVKIGPDNSGYE